MKISSLAQVIPRLEHELLLMEVLQVARSFCYSHPEYELTPEQYRLYDSLLQRRLAGEPIAYILGKRDFWSFELLVNDQVLIPRPATEVLVTVVLEYLPTTLQRIADLGTGSGAIALALAYERQAWQVVASDISKEALVVAQANAQRLQLTNVEFVAGNWLDAFSDTSLTAIVSNPPYISYLDKHLTQGDVRFEPQRALVAGAGLMALARIIAKAPAKLQRSGWLFLEHGYTQQKAVMQLMHKAGFVAITPFNDYDGNPRVVVGKNTL